MRKTHWFIALLFAVALVFGASGCKNLTDDEDITIVSDETQTETVETYLYDVVSSDSYSSSGRYSVKTYNDDYYRYSSSSYRSSVYDDDDNYYSGYLTYYYSQYEAKTYYITSAKLEKTSYKYANYTKYELTLNGYLYSTESIDSDGETSTDYTKNRDQDVTAIGTFSFYKAGGKFYRDEQLSEEVSFDNGNLDSGTFSLSDITFNDTKTYVASVSETSSSTSSYYNYYNYYNVYKKTTGSSYSFTMLLKRK